VSKNVAASAETRRDRSVYLFESVVQDTPVFPSLRQLFTFVTPTLIGTPRRAATLAVALLVLMGLLAGFLTRDYDATRERLALGEFRAGANQAEAYPGEAAEYFRAALALDRDNVEARRALAITLLQLGRLGEAETHVIELLQADPIDGEANLLRARIGMRRNQLTDAAIYYPRAIYGRWPDEQAPEHVAAHFEFVELLERTGRRVEARAELLKIDAELPDLPPLQRELARRFVELGDSAQAADILQRLTKAHPSDASAARALTEALLGTGKFREAREAASHAIAIDPQDQGTRERLTQINEALSLDPTVRGLSASSRLRRSGVLLARVLQDVESCMAKPENAPPAVDWNDLHARAQAALAAIASARDTDALEALTEQRLTVIEELWRLRVSRCGSAEGPVAWIADRLAH